MQLIDIVRCPATRQSLAWLEMSQVDELNTLAADGTLRLRDGTVLDRGLEGALTTPDGEVVYPVVDGILRLLESSAIEPPNPSLLSTGEVAESKRTVREFYEEVGWTKSDDGEYTDTLLFEDLRPVSRRYNADTRLRVNDYIDHDGTFLLDIASGAVPFDEYVTYSDGYVFRICADFSLRALSEAQARLGERGIYVQCDITRLPFRDDSIDGFVSLHTMYHVQAEEQSKAFSELVRILRAGRRGVVVYSWQFPSPLMMIFHPTGTAKRLFKSVAPERVVAAVRGRLASETAPEEDNESEPLYFHPFGYSWYRTQLERPYGARLASWRSVSMSFQQRFAHDRWGGERVLRYLYLLEERFPHLMGRIGQYPMFVFRK